MEGDNVMIKNIVFDMGMVLVKYDSMRACRHFIKDEAEQKEVCTAVFQSPEWIYLDMGLITEEDALKKMCARVPDRLHDAVGLCLGEWHKHCMWPNRDIEPLIRYLKNRDYGLYVCSNASLRLLSCYRDVIPAEEIFDGFLFSAEVKCIKPQKEMYEHFFNRFSLNPEECFFIDDLQLNIEGGKRCGMDGYCFADGDVERLRKVLEQLNSIE